MDHWPAYVHMYFFIFCVAALFFPPCCLLSAIVRELKITKTRRHDVTMTSLRRVLAADERTEWQSAVGSAIGRGRRGRSVSQRVDVSSHRNSVRRSLAIIIVVVVVARCRCHIKMSPHEKSARGEIITDLICLLFITISPAP